MAGKYPDWKGDTQLKNADGKTFDKIGESVAWQHSEKFISGQVSFDASKVEPDSEGKITVRFFLGK